jgi:uncharacterized damage-inducible protein DinB
MSRTEIATLERLLDQTLETGGESSLLANLSTVRDEDWLAVPDGGVRSIADVLEHVAWAKWMYNDYAFKSASLVGDAPPIWVEQPRPRDELMEWLHEGHRRFRASVKALGDDSELERARLTNWGELKPTRWIITAIAHHDTFHAGEINHIRALLQGDDSWAYEGPAPPFSSSGEPPAGSAAATASCP